MTTLHPPGHEPDLDDAQLERWTAFVSRRYMGYAQNGATGPGGAWLVDPSVTVSGTAATITWDAYPNQRSRTSLAVRQQVDLRRAVQDEYCEWAVTRDDAGRIARVTFTTEVPDFYEFLYRDSDATRAVLLGLYHRYVSAEVALDDLGDGSGYDIANRWNVPTPADGGILHMGQRNNTLGAALGLAVAASTPVIGPDGAPVVDEQPLIACLGFGEPCRNSDPHIGAQVNSVVRSGNRLTFADPPGLHLQTRFADLLTPDGSSIDDWVKVVRGPEEAPVRIEVAAPQGSGLTIEDLTDLDGNPITTGSDLALLVRVELAATVIPTDDAVPTPVRFDRIVLEDCGDPDAPPAPGGAGVVAEDDLAEAAPPPPVDLATATRI